MCFGRKESSVLASIGVHSAIVNALADEEGIDEDPVTGSAHCSLATLWVERLGWCTLTERPSVSDARNKPPVEQMASSKMLSKKNLYGFHHDLQCVAR